MRILFKDCLDEVTVLEITYATYVMDISYHVPGDEIRRADGLHIIDVDGDEWVLPSVPAHVCELIMEDLLRNGIYDFRNGVSDWRLYSVVGESEDM